MPQRIEMWRPPRGNAKIRRMESRPNAYARGYCDPKHKAWRMAVLLRDAYACRACGRVCGKKREAHADHIVPVKVRPDLRYEVDNGQCLCHGCHSRKTTQESR
jgi:5-methylcytosine-specific restriction protein A